MDFISSITWENDPLLGSIAPDFSQGDKELKTKWALAQYFRDK